MKWKKRSYPRWQEKLQQLVAAKVPILNFFSLGLLKATDAIILLFLIPVIISRVGIAHYGLIAFAQVGLNYGRAIVDYGFNITAVRQISLAQREGKQLSGIFFQVLYCKAVLAILIILALVLLVNTVPFLQSKAVVFYWGTPFVVGHVFFSDWFFIGLQKSHLLAMANLLVKCLYAISILLWVQEPGDYIYVLALQGGAAIFIGVMVLAYIIQHFKLKMEWPNPHHIWYYLRSDFRLLGTNLAIEINSSYSLVILNILLGDVITGYFNVMYKLVQPLRFLLAIFSQTIFPIICEKTKDGWKAVRHYIKHSFLLFAAFPLLGILLLWLFGESVFAYFAGTVNESLVHSLRLYLLVPVAILSNIPAYQVLLAYEFKSAYTSIYVLGLLGNLFLAYVMTLHWGLNGLIGAIITVELFISLGLYVIMWKNLPYFANEKGR
ncbi:MAG: oligosaccharide flippase family protein [Saprospiraceae bacterium]